MRRRKKEAGAISASWQSAGWSQGSDGVEGEGLAGGQRGCGKCLYISGAGPWGGDGMGVSGETNWAVCATGTALMTSVCPVTGSWASWACAGWCRCADSDVNPPSSISWSRLSILARPQSLMNWSCSIICQVMLCRVGSRSNSSPKRPLESYWRSLM